MIETAAPSIRIANFSDTEALLRLARHFFALHPMARLVDYDEACAREFIEHVLDTGVVFLLVEDGVVVGGLMAMLAPAVRYSRDLVAIELGWFVEPSHRGHGEKLRRRFEEWAREGGAKAVLLSDVKFNDAMPNGDLYTRAGYEVLERAWGKEL